MAYVYDNKTYRNLQQQVKENMENIAELQDLKLVGIDVAGIVADSASLPSSAEQGQVYAVGSASPYELYVYNDSSWVDFGEFPKAGPKGEQGPQGEPGRQGPRGLTGLQGPRGYTGAPGTPGQAGPQGEKGPKGDKGDTGLVEAFAKDAASVTAVGQAYVDENGYLQVCTSLSPLTFKKGGYIKGPMGERGPSGQQGVQGIQGPEGPVGPQGPKGDTGEPSSIKVNGTTYTRDASGLITLPDYPDEVTWGNIQGTLSNQIDLKNALDAKIDATSLSKVATSGSYNDLTDRPLFKYPGDVVQYGTDPIRTIYGGKRAIFENAGHPGTIVGDIIDLSLPTLTWGHDYDAINGPISAYGYNDNPDTVEACYKCWRTWLDVHNAKTGDTINLRLKYTDSAGELHTFSGTGVIHSDSFIDPVLKEHKIILDNVNFSSLNVDQRASFSIIPKYGQIDLYMLGYSIKDSNNQTITNITISMNVGPNDRIITPINSDFIGTDIARTADIPTKTSQLTNNSGFITSDSLATVATSGSYNDLIDKPTITTVSDYVSYGEAQELTTEQKNQAKSNLDLPYISSEETAVITNKNNVVNPSANSDYSIYDSNYSFKKLLNLPEGVKIKMTATSPDGSFTETVYAETFGTDWYRTTTDCTNTRFFNTTSKQLYPQGNNFNFSKKDTSEIVSSSDKWKFTISYWKPIYNNLISKEFINSSIVADVKYKAPGSGSLPTAVFNSPNDEASGSTIADGNVVFGSSNKIQNTRGSTIIGWYNNIPSNNKPKLIVGTYNVCGWRNGYDGVSPFNKAFMLGDYLRGSQNNTYNALVSGKYNDRTSKYIPYDNSKTYNTGDCVTANQTNFTPAVWKCLQDGLTGSSNQPPTSGTTGNAKWEYVDNGSTTEYLFTIGNGTSDTSRSNAFTIDALGNVVSAGTMTPTGADYAEYFEFEDGNPTIEDRIGYLVELSGAKIKLANGTDILGAVSSTMGVIGDAEEMNWHGKYERDEFGRPLFEEVEVEKEITNEETGETETVKELVTTKKLSKKYDPNRHYAPRCDRPEWAPVGLLGKVLVRHDGTLSAGDYVKAVNGIASKSEEKTNVRVLEVVSDKVIKVLIK